MKKFEKQGEVWNACGYENENIDLAELKPNQSCIIYDSTNVNVLLPLKLVTLSLVNCKVVNVHVNSLISGLELTNCHKVKVYVRDTLPSAAIDKCQQVNFWITKKNAKTILFTTCKSGDMNVNINKNENGKPEDDDWVEQPIHEQFEHHINDQLKVVSKPSSLYP